MSASRCLERLAEGWRGRLGSWVIFGKKGQRCLLWMAPAVGEEMAKALVLWGDGILVSCRVEFGGIQWSDALGILEGGVLGCCFGNGGVVR